MDRDRILLTPGPLTTTLRTKLAMLRDWGSWDADFNAVTASVRRSLLDIVHGHDSHVVVPLQGSGTFSVEAAVATVVPRDGHVLVLDNGAYCKRAAKLTNLMGRRTTVVPFAEDEPVSAAVLDARLKDDLGITHVVLIHCETGTGVLNPLPDVADGVRAARQGPDRRCDESFARAADRCAQVRFDALVAASGKCLEGVPGMGFVFLRKAILDRLRGPQPEPGDGPARPVRLHGEDGPVALHAADARGGGAGRGDRPVRRGRWPARAPGPLHRQLPDADQRHGGARLQALPAAGVQAPIIVTFHAPAHPHTTSSASTRPPRRVASSSTRASSRSSRPSASAASAPSAATRCSRR